MIVLGQWPEVPSEAVEATTRQRKWRRGRGFTEEEGIELDLLVAAPAIRKQAQEELGKLLLEPGGPIAAASNAVIRAELADDAEQACAIAYQIVGAAVHNALDADQSGGA